MKRSARFTAGLMAIALLLGAACGGVAASGVSGNRIRALLRPALQGTVGGLAIKTEDVAGTVRQFHNSYADAVSVYSLREKGLLQATLQVSRFTDGARLRKASFRRGLIDQIASGTRAQVVRVAATDVEVSRGTGQRLFVWFGDRDVFVLSVRDAYRGRYGLLRSVLQVVKT